MSSNFTVIWICVTFKTCQKDGFPKRAVASFTNGFSGPKSFRDFRETGLGSLVSRTLLPFPSGKCNSESVSILTSV